MLVQTKKGNSTKFLMTIFTKIREKKSLSLKDERGKGMAFFEGG